ncbi:hypothetical protein [Streptomyces sp. NPDC016845]|uniref:hypothetical protein n=1 Tax=Streptomyces sp. NPDC016845 TaxID=3364972 RepID=UPI00379581EC
MNLLQEVWGALRRRPFDDRGGVSVFVAVLTGPLILLAGLLTVDALAELRSHERSDALAVEAARAAQQAVDLNMLIPARGIRIDPAAARAAARTYLARAHATGTVRTGHHGRTITVTVTGTYRGLFWPHTYTHHVSSTATLLYGTTRPQNGEIR